MNYYKEDLKKMMRESGMSEEQINESERQVLQGFRDAPPRTTPQSDGSAQAGWGLFIVFIILVVLL